MGLCTLAVAAIYAAGYTYTEPSAQATTSDASINGHQNSNKKNHDLSHNPTSTTPTSSSSTITHKSGQAQQAVYKDGVYTGAGENQFGTLSVAVRVAYGKIASVRITSYNMHYSQSYIDPQMPNQVVSMQTWRVYVVSGATASSYNFAEAVYSALQKAKA